MREKKLKFLNTRPGEAGLSLQQQLDAINIPNAYFPTIEIEPVENPAGLAALMSANQVVFISPNAARFGVQYLDKTLCQPLLAVGLGTANALESLGLRVAESPEQFSSEGLLALPCLQQVKGQVIAIIKGVGGRALLRDKLISRGAEVVEVDVYRRVKPDVSVESMILDEVGLILMTSVESAQNLLAMTPAALREQLLTKAWLATSPRIGLFLKEQLGDVEIILAADARNETLVRLLESLSKSP